MKYYQGILKLKNPQKYAGNPENVVYRSSWEARLYQWLDEQPNVVAWGVEELAITYISPKDKKPHRYYPDGLVRIRGLDGIEQNYMIEVKPYSKTQPPIQGKRKSKKFLNEAMEYAVNQAKWAYAKKWCEKNGWRFLVVTEYDLFPKSK